MVAGKLSVILRWKEHVKPVLVDMGLGDFPPTVERPRVADPDPDHSRGSESRKS